MLTHLQEVVTEALIALEGWPAGKIASPEHVGAIGIRKEVVLLHCPGEIGLVQLPEVTRRGGVENVDEAPVYLLRVDQADQLVHVFEPHVGILIMEV